MTGLSAVGLERHQVLDPAPLVGAKLEGDGDQPVALADPGRDCAGEAAAHEAGDVLMGDPGEVGPVGVDLQRKLEDLRIPIVLDVGAAGEFAHESLDLLAEVLDRRQVLPLNAYLHGNADRRAGLDLLDDQPSRRARSWAARA